MTRDQREAEARLRSAITAYEDCAAFTQQVVDKMLAGSADISDIQGEARAGAIAMASVLKKTINSKADSLRLLVDQAMGMRQ